MYIHSIMQATKRTYSVEEIAHLGLEVVEHMRACGSVTWETWYAYLKTPMALRYIALVQANPRLRGMF